MGNRIPYERTRTVFLNGEVVEIKQPEYRILQNQMFMNIWRERDHRCSILGERLYWEAGSYYFHHILEKRAFEIYALCRWNITILSQEIHNRYESNPMNVPVLHAYRAGLIEQLAEDGCQFDNIHIWNEGIIEPDHTPAVFGRSIEIIY